MHLLPCEVIVKGSWINRLFLARLREDSYMVQKKAFIFAWISILLIPLLIIPTIINLTTEVSTHPIAISIANILMIVGFIAALLFLRKGRFDISVRLGIIFVSLRVIVGVLAKIDTWITTGNNNNIYFMFAALAFTAFYGTRRWQLAMAFVFIAINTGVMFYSWHISSPGFNLLLGSTINVVIAIIITMSLSWLVSFIAERALLTTEEELQKNIALGMALEQRISELHSVNKRLEVMNEELKKSSEELVDANKNLIIYKNFAEESGQGLGMSHTDGTVMYANRALAGLLGAEGGTALIGRKFIENYPDDVKPTVLREIVPKVMREGQWIGELPLLAMSGRTIPTIQNIFIIHDKIGRQDYLALVVTDLTERKQLEMKLLMAQKMEAIGKLTGGIVHDFNNILTVIMGFSDLLLRSLDTDDPRRTYVEEIKKTGNFSSEIVRQLLAFSRNQIVKISDFDLNIEINSMHKMLRRLIREDIEIIINIQEEPLIIHADPSQVGQVIINLAINANDAIPDRGTITIRTGSTIVEPGDDKNAAGAVPGIYALLSIQDNGVGMDEETLHHLFEPFFSTKEPDKGTGLGLSVVYGIVKQNNGWISITSSKGVGTTFDVLFPLKKEKAPFHEEQSASEGFRRGNFEKILVVEDQEKVRTFAAASLRDNNYSVLEASCAEDAEVIFEREGGRIDLLFTDVVLPGKSGIMLIDDLRSKNRDLRVLLASGYTDQRAILDLIEERGYTLLHKPYSLDDLLERVWEILHRQ